MSGALALQAEGGSAISEYVHLGPLVASFLANLLATVGDKGQLVVIVLATRYDAKRVFLGAMGAFAVWSSLEVALGQWIVAVLPAGVLTLVTGGLFLAFGAWTLWGGLRRIRVDSGPVPGGTGRASRFLPATLGNHLGAYGGVLTSFVFVLVAEFGDKTQLLTINLAATFPDAPLAVLVGVLAALALRTGVDAIIGERVERALPTHLVEFGAAAIFVVAGLVVLGLVPEFALLWVVLAIATAILVVLLRRRQR